MTTSSSKVADEEQIVFTQANNNNGSKKQTPQRKKQSHQAARDWEAKEELSSLRTSNNDFIQIDGNITSSSMNEIEGNAPVRKEKNVGVALKNLKLRILGQPHDEVLLTTNRRYKLHKANEDRMFFRNAFCSASTTKKLVTSTVT